jgi:hypothetical protein
MPSLLQGHLLIYSRQPKEFRNRLQWALFAAKMLPKSTMRATGLIVWNQPQNLLSNPRISADPVQFPERELVAS